jgi:ParB-like chromosome segregation protein Spo0J
MNVDHIIIGERFRKQSGNVRQLAESTQRVGLLLHPIVVTPKGELIAGAWRVVAFRLLGRKDIPVTVIDMDDIALGEVEGNQRRKDFTVSERVTIKRELEARLPERVGRPAKKGANLAQLKGEKTGDVAAEFAGVSHGTLAEAESIVRAAERDPEKFGKLLQKKQAPRRSLRELAREALMA